MRESKANPSPTGASRPLVTPLYPSAVYVLPDLDTLDQIMEGEETGYIYARDRHPNAVRLAERLAALEEAGWALVGGSGMAAISAIALSLVQKEDRIVASNRLYGRTTQLFTEQLGAFGVTTTYVDANDLDAVASALRTPTRLLFVETLSNPLLRVVDLPALVELAREYGCRLVVDNTFASPVLTRPLALGADLVMESLTKMIGGHSDVTLGIVAGQKKDAESLLPQMSQVVSIWGLSGSPFDCWLAERGLDSLPLRMRAASANALALAEWLPQQRGVKQVVYPGCPDHPDHELACSLLQGGFGHMLCFELAGGREAVNTFMQHAPGVPFSPSLGHTFTTCSHPATTSHRYTSPAERGRQGISDGLLRVSVGFEDLGRIQEEMTRGLEKL